MAYIGLEYPVAAKIEKENENARPTYTGGMVIGRAMSGNVSFERNNEEMYADNVIAESDNSIIGGTVTLQLDKLVEAAKKLLLNMKEDATNAGDVIEYSGASPEVGFGYIRNQRFKGKPLITAYWIFKVQFGLSNEDIQTKQKNYQFQGESIEGNMMPIAVNDTGEPAVRIHREFDTIPAAKAWLNSLAGIASGS